MSQVDDIAGLEALLEQLKSARGLDFTGYKRSSLSRRIRRRMDALGIAGYAEYAAHLERTPEEYGVLFSSILINVTAFFRDPESWASLREQVLPRLIEDARGGPLRVWCAGCASGEEPYTLAMILAELLGVDELCRRVKIYATDWDEDALAHARRARYLPEQVEAVPAELRERYFTRVDGKAVFDGTLRRAVIFGRHDLTEDPPISKLDLLICRNTLMYFTMATQARVLQRLHFGLAERGVLFLGRAEMLLSYGHAFAPLELRHRLFYKVGAGVVPPARERVAEAVHVAERIDPLVLRLREAALDAGPIAQVVFDADDRLALFNQRAAEQFQLGEPEIGKRLQDLEISYRPGDLRTMLDRAREQRAAVVREVSRTAAPGGELQYFEVTLTPLYQRGEPLATSVTFDDVTRHHTMQDHLQQFSENLETAYEELQSANEELETTNEELQSSNEELETTNEELQAANEEMETINEELRSTNEELQSTNEQLRVREGELDDANGFLQAILSSLSAGVAVVDHELRVRVWNARAEELWGVRADEVRGVALTDLDIGLPVVELATPLRDALRTGEVAVVAVDAVNRRGRALRCRVTVSPLQGAAPAAATLLMDPIVGDEP